MVTVSKSGGMQKPSLFDVGRRNAEVGKTERLTIQRPTAFLDKLPVPSTKCPEVAEDLVEKRGEGAGEDTDPDHQSQIVFRLSLPGQRRFERVALETGFRP